MTTVADDLDAYPDDLAGELADEPTGRLPVLAVVGRPNVGKSTLVNRILGRRAAVVEDVPGVTRDRVAYDAVWNGRRFTLVDTGGWEPDAKGLAARVSDQARAALDTADAVLFVIDTTTGATDADEAVARVLHRSGIPVVLAANKVDDTRGEADAAALWSLGLGEPWPVSALHGRGSGDMLDAVLEALPPAPRDVETTDEGPRRVALVGRPNVGKSSLLNKLAGSQRSLVHDVAGTTRDPVDELVTVGGEVWKFIDTAGLRRRVKEASGAEYYSSLRTAAALEAAEVGDRAAGRRRTADRAGPAGHPMVVEAGRALVIAFNKWDLVDEDRRLTLDKEIMRDLAPGHLGAAGERLGPHRPRHRQAGAGAAHRARVVGDPSPDRPAERLAGRRHRRHAAAGARGKIPRVLFATQAGTRPPRFVIFSTGFLEPSYRRFLERRLREDFGFAGTPIEISIRVRERGERPRR